MIDSSPPPSTAAESSFRELDEVFLQTQTRIWLGELLHTRLDEDIPLSDLLQDGEILFEVSKVVWDFLMTKCMELRHLKQKYGPFGSKKSSGRYRPYSNVDSFLKICKILGLNGIDLFSPSDVVEKRNNRKVCICIRALSKKARSKQLSVPDFDMVIHSVTMPTDMVGVIRRSLESSQSTFSSSSSYGSCKGSKVKPKQRNLYAQGIRDDDSSISDESDEAESRYMGENLVSSPSKFDNADEVNSDPDDAAEESSISGQYRRQKFVESDVKGQCTASDFDNAASCYSFSKRKSYLSISEITNEERQNFTHENGDAFMGDSSCPEVGENNYIANYLAFSDLMVHATDSSNSVVLDGENNTFDFFLNVDPQGASKGEKCFHNGSQRVYSDDEDMEVSSTTSMSSVLGRLLNLEFDNQFDDYDSSSTKVHSSASVEPEYKKHHNDASVISEPPKDDTFHTQLFGSQETRFKVATRASSPLEFFCLPSQEEGEIPLSREDDDKESAKAIIRCSDEDTVERGRSEFLELSNTGILDEDAKRFSAQAEDIAFQDIDSLQETVSHSVPIEHTSAQAENNTSSTDENSGQDKGENSLDSTKEESDSQLPSMKDKGRPLLKTVVKGTAIAGVVFLLLHIRKSNANSAHERLQNPRSSSSNYETSSGKQRSRSVGKGIYPTEKLKL